MASTYSLRTSGKIERSNSHEIDYLTHFDTFISLTQLQDLELKLSPSGSYTVTGITSIKELTLMPAGGSTVNLTINAGNGDYTMACNSLVLLRGISLSNVQLANPSSSSSVSARLIVGG